MDKGHLKRGALIIEAGTQDNHVGYSIPTCCELDTYAGDTCLICSARLDNKIQ